MFNVAGLKKLHDRYLSDICVLETLTNERDDTGSVVKRWNGVVLKCRVITAQPTRRNSATETVGQYVVREEYRVIFVAGTSVSAGDRIRLIGKSPFVWGRSRWGVDRWGGGTKQVLHVVGINNMGTDGLGVEVVAVRYD